MEYFKQNCGCKSDALPRSFCLIPGILVHWAVPVSSLRRMSHADSELICVAAIQHNLLLFSEIKILPFFSVFVRKKEMNKPSIAIPPHIDQTFAIKNVCSFTFAFQKSSVSQTCMTQIRSPEDTISNTSFIIGNVKNGHALSSLQLLFKDTRHD